MINPVFSEIFKSYESCRKRQAYLEKQCLLYFQLRLVCITLFCNSSSVFVIHGRIKLRNESGVQYCVIVICIKYYMYKVKLHQCRISTSVEFLTNYIPSKQEVHDNKYNKLLLIYRSELQAAARVEQGQNYNIKFCYLQCDFLIKQELFQNLSGLNFVLITIKLKSKSRFLLPGL